MRLPEIGVTTVRRPTPGCVTTARHDTATTPSFDEHRFTVRSPNLR